MSNKYNINECFGIRAHVSAPVNQPVTMLAGVALSNIHKLLNKTEGITVKTYKVDVENGDMLIHVIRPDNPKGKLPCIIDIHGGGFVFDAAPHMYELAARYAIESGSVVIMPRYRLTPRNNYPVQLNDCRAAYDWVVNNAGKLHIDRDKIALMGDSAGGYLAAMTTLYAVERGDNLKFQLLIYPVTDPAMTTESMANYIDTPVWNAKNNRSMWKMYFRKQEVDPKSQSLLFMNLPDGIPATYIETAEFDCLHDEGILYAKRLEENQGVSVTLYETKETMHGFDETKCDITEDAVKRRINYIKEHFKN